MADTVLVSTHQSVALECLECLECWAAVVVYCQGGGFSNGFQSGCLVMKQSTSGGGARACGRWLLASKVCQLLSGHPIMFSGINHTELRT